jgi:hypothetical protein
MPVVLVVLGELVVVGELVALAVLGELVELEVLEVQPEQLRPVSTHQSLALTP